MSAWLAWVMSAPPKRIEPRGRLVELEHRAADRGLAAAGFADQAERLARHDVDRDVVHRLHGRGRVGEEAGAGGLHGEVFLQVIDDEQRLGAALRQRGRAGLLRSFCGGTSVPAMISFARMQADAWSGATGASGGSICVHASIRYGQRGAKRQPGRRIAQVGRQALDGLELDAARHVEPRDRAHQPDGVRVRRLEEHVVGGALLDDARRIHHVHAVGVARHDAEIVRDDRPARCRGGATGPSSVRGSAPGW